MLSNSFALVARDLRNGITENWHFGVCAVVTPEGQLVGRVGDPSLEVFIRSAAKPFQVMPFLQAGGQQEFGL